MRTKNIILILTIFMCMMSGCGNTSTTYTVAEQPHLYWKDITCEITDIDYRHWYASAHHYTADVTVVSTEYNLTKTFHLTGNNAKECESIKKGDTISCELNSWVIDSTGEIIRREISHIN